MTVRQKQPLEDVATKRYRQKIVSLVKVMILMIVIAVLYPVSALVPGSKINQMSKFKLSCVETMKFLKNVTKIKKLHGVSKNIHGVISIGHLELLAFSYKHAGKRCRDNQQLHNMFDNAQYRNVVKLYGYCGCTFFVEVLPGGSLQEKNILPQSRKVRFERAVSLANGIVELNNEGLVYCEWKPDEFLFDGNGVLKINDLDHVRISKGPCGCDRRKFFYKMKNKGFMKHISMQFGKKARNCRGIMRSAPNVNFNVVGNLFQVFGIQSMMRNVLNFEEYSKYEDAVLNLEIQTTSEFLKMLIKDAREGDYAEHLHTTFS